MEIIKKILKSQVRRFIIISYLVFAVGSISASCHVWRLNESVGFLNCDLLYLVSLFVSCVSLLAITLIKKHRVISVILLTPFVLVPLLMSAFSVFVALYFRTPLFMNDYVGFTRCDDGNKIACQTNKDCEWERVKKYCASHKAESKDVGIINRLSCPTANRCGSDNFCVEYCHGDVFDFFEK